MIDPTPLPLAFLLALVSLALGAAGCTGPDAAAEETTVAPWPTDWQVVCGQGGGFTGRWTGYTIAADTTAADGTVQAWAGRYAGDGIEQEGRISPEALRRLWEQFTALNFFEQPMGTPTNMTATVQAVADGQRHRIVWSPRVEGLEPVGSPVETFYEACRAEARAALDAAGP